MITLLNSLAFNLARPVECADVCNNANKTVWKDG